MISKDKIKFPTGKPHVSFSEVRCWAECPLKHKLTYIDKLAPDDPSPYLSYGTTIHDAIESFLNTGIMDIEKAIEKLKLEWVTHDFDGKKFKDAHALKRKNKGWRPKPLPEYPEWENYARTALSALPDYLSSTFPNYKVISAEEELYEFYPNSEIYFKGFIDAILEVPTKKGAVYYILDWKTAGDKGWYRDKRQDIKTWAQIALYQRFWRLKKGYDIKETRCGFLLLKRGAKEKDCCELVKVSVGPKAEDKSLSMLRSMIKNTRRGLYLKNRGSCNFCDFEHTIHCP